MKTLLAKESCKTNRAEELIKILEENPFREVCENWRAKIKERRNADFEKLSKDRYILPYDEGKMCVCNAEELGFCKGLRTALLPLPFCGDPQAHYWYIQINPRGNWIDFYDFISCNSDLKKEIQRRLQEDDGLSIEFCKIGETENIALERRQELYINQLGLYGDSLPFYPMMPEFQTIKNCINRRKLIGSHNWWRSALCVNNPNALFNDVFQEKENNSFEEKAKKLGRHLFVMEYFPYASEHADIVRNLYKNKDYYNEHPYRKFVVKMLTFAQEQGKKIIFRSKKELDLVKSALGCSISGDIHILGGQRVYLMRKGI
jgi:hypothetical protein